jgi:hypothetical protein
MLDFQTFKIGFVGRAPAACERKATCFEFKAVMRSNERLEWCAIPEIRSVPKAIEFPEPGNQQRELVIQLADLLMFFQRGEADLDGGVVDLSQESRVANGMYLSFKTECQIPAWVFARHREVVARAWVECSRLRIPQPPFLFGLAKYSQLQRC